MIFDFQPCDLRSLCDSVLKEFSMFIAERNLSLQYTRPPGPAIASVDNQRFMQVVRNLLSNAIKFSVAGSTITLCIVHHYEHLRLTVQDQGLGFPPTSSKPFLTNSFKRAVPKPVRVARAWGSPSAGKLSMPTAGASGLPTHPKSARSSPLKFPHWPPNPPWLKKCNKGVASGVSECYVAV